MNRTICTLLIAWIVCRSAATAAQVRSATDAEIGAIRAAAMLGEAPESPRYRVLEVQAAFTQGPGDRPDRLDGWVYFHPNLSPAAVCVMEARFVTGVGNDDGFDWTIERFAYWNWLATGGADCAIGDRSDVPASAVQSSEPIPVPVMSYVLSHSDELLAQAYSQVQAAGELPDSERERLLNRFGSPHRLERLGSTGQSSPEFGRAFSASYRAGSEPETLLVVFFVTAAGFVVQGIR